MELSSDVNHRPIIFIRFNPDCYLDQNGKRVLSCWGTTKDKGLLVVKKQKDWDSRLNMLKETVSYWMENFSDKTVQVVELFFDQNLE